MAYYDVQNLTIRHVKCTWKIPVSDAQTKCQTCKTYRDNVLRSGLSRLLKQKEDEERSSKVCAVDSHVNYRYLTTPEKFLRMRNLHIYNGETTSKEDLSAAVPIRKDYTVSWSLSG